MDFVKNAGFTNEENIPLETFQSAESCEYGGNGYLEVEESEKLSTRNLRGINLGGGGADGGADGGGGIAVITAGGSPGDGGREGGRGGREGGRDGRGALEVEEIHEKNEDTFDLEDEGIKFKGTITNDYDENLFLLIILF